MDFDSYASLKTVGPTLALAGSVSSETSTLSDVMLCPPAYLAPVPCCSVTVESLRNGFTLTRAEALEQHRQLRVLLEDNGVNCHLLPPSAELPDLCFMRDAAVMTPWGLLGLRPNARHRQSETELVTRFATSLGVKPLGQIYDGRVEGGDVCIARPGLIIIGCSGDRTNWEGAQALAAIFKRWSWKVLVYRFDPHFLHLDTQFCMLDENTALACLEVLDDAFICELKAHGIDLVEVSYKEARRLACNVLSLGENRILAAADNPRVSDVLLSRGFDVIEIDISQFTRCGGGVHCLTLPLARSADGTPSIATRHVHGMTRCAFANGGPAT